jgi:hypothetical protein
MKTTLLRSQALAGLASLALAFLFLCSSSYAAGQGTGVGKGKDDGDDDIGSLPASAAEDAPSVVFMGTLSELQSVVVGVSGTGKLSLRPAAPGSARLLLEVEGSMELTLDAAALAGSKVKVFFNSGNSFAGGMAMLFADGAWSGVHHLGLFSTQALPLLTGDVQVRAFSLERQAYVLGSHPAAGGMLRMKQALR